MRPTEMEIVDAMVEFGLSATIHTEATIRGRVWQATCHLTKDRDPEEAPDFGAALAAAARALAAEMDDLAICDGSNVWQAIGIKPAPDQAQLVVEHVESNVRALASFVQLGLDAGAADREALATLRRLALDAVNAVGLCPCSDPDGDCAKVRALSDALPPEDEHG